MKVYLKEVRVHHSDNPEPSIHKNPMPQSITEIMKPEGDHEGDTAYIKKYRFHFNRGLSEYAVSQLKFRDRNTKPFEYDKVLELMRDIGISLPDNATQGDLHYVINKIRSEYSTDTVKTDIRALKMAIECLESQNLMEGEIFLQWIEHMYRVKKDILWEKFME